MRRVVKWWLVILSLVVSANGAALAADPVCVPMGDGTLRCTIARVSDCNAIRDYPYARNLFCPAAFSAAREMVSLLEQTLEEEKRTDELLTQIAESGVNQAAFQAGASKGSANLL